MTMYEIMNKYNITELNNKSLIIVRDEELKQTVLDNQKERLADFTYEKIAAQFKELLQKQVI